MTKILLYIRLIPELIKAVRDLEDVIPLPSVGAAKLDLLLNLLKAFYDAEEAVRKEIPWDTLRSVIANAVSIVVSALNALGIFRKKGPK